MPVELVCDKCGKHFTKPASVAAKRRFCSAKCYGRKGAENPKWRGGRITIHGYIYVFMPKHPSAIKSGYVAEHRLVMEQKIARYLSRREVVHHIDGNTTNNHPDNLELCSSCGTHAVTHHAKRNSKGKFGATSPTTHPNQKLSAEQQQCAIRRREAGETYRAIAESYGVTISCIAGVVRKARQ